MKSQLFLASVAMSIGVFGATVSVVAPQEGAAKSVTVAGKESATLDAGSMAALKATANAGWSFAGWYSSYDAGEFSGEVNLAQSADWRSASANYVVGSSNETLYARFVKPAEDTLTFDIGEVLGAAAYDVDDVGRPLFSLTEEIDATVEVDSESFPTFSIAGLPAGLSFDAKSLRLSGKPSSPGVFRVSASAKNPSGYAYSQICYVRVDNASSEHVIGLDNDNFYVGDKVNEDADYYFEISNPNSEVTAMSVKGLPPGLALVTEKDDDYTYYAIQGTASKAGDYVVWCTVSFADGTSEKASLLFTVNELDPFYYDVDVDFSGLDGYSVGDTISAEDGEEVVIGTYDSEDKIGVTAVSGLPSGIVAVKRTDGDGNVEYVLSGTFTKAGEFTPTVKVAYDDVESESIKTATFSKKVIVGDSAGVYLSAEVLEPEYAPGCKVAGSGVYAAGAVAKLTATAGSGYVFAGWCDEAGIPQPVAAQDYRKSPLSVGIASDVNLEWYAYFIPKADDYIDMSDLEDAEMEIDTGSGEVSSFVFVVDSGSLPTIKFKNLPTGVECVPSAEVAGAYELTYDPLTAKRAPSPGRYAVTATGTNASRGTDSATFEVTVLNYTDEDIDVLDDYGVLTPNVAMTPISFADAVDFARGDTLKVSGLPAGVKYDDKSAPLSLSGTPTKPGDYTLTFTAKIVTGATTNAQGRVTTTTRTGVATAFIKVKEFPTISAVIDDAAAAAGNKVSGAGSFKAGSKTTLKATAAKGWVFAGWTGAGLEGLAALNPSASYVVGTNDLTEVYASFIEVRDDMLFVEDPGVVAVVKGAAVSTNLVETLITTYSAPTVSLAGLPTGLKFDAKTYLISGAVGATAKAGYYYATLTAKNAGGYTFTRVLKFVVLDSPEEEIPDEPELANAANIDFSALDEMYTGDFYPADDVEALALYVDPSEAGADVAAVSLSGLPAGLKSAVTIENGFAEVLIFGTPTKAGRCTLKVSVTYSDRSKATSEYAFTVQDGGSAWLDVVSFDDALGTASGSGVYASGASVKLSAKPSSGYVFAGWYEDEAMPFGGISEMDGVDFRTANASFVFRLAMFENDPPVLFADFVGKSADADPVKVSGLDDTWEISPDEDDELPFEVASASLPKITVSGLPKGVTLDAAGQRFVYSSAAKAQIVPGYYTVTLKAVNLSNASATAKLSVFVENKTTDAIEGLDPSADAYPLYAGVALDPEAIMPEVDATDGWKLAATGLPAGLKLVQDKETGAYSVSGIATKAGTNTVTFTASKGTTKEVATITVAVAALPEWAYGTYDGAYCEFGEEGTNAVGQVTATVSSAGKVSGKILKGGKSYSFSAASYGEFDPDGGCFVAVVTVPWSTSDREDFVISVCAGEDGLGVMLLEPVGDGARYAEAVQNAWLRKDLAMPAFATGTKQPVLNVDGLVCKFGAKGVVTVSGSADGVAVSGKPQLLAVEQGDGFLVGRFVVYAANAKFEGGAFCEVVDVRLTDTDGDGALDAVQLNE